MNVSYGHSPRAMPTLDDEVARVLEDGAKRICDVGGGANPVASAVDIERLGVEYIVLDADRAELAKAPSAYDTVVLDINDRAAVDRFVAGRGPFDAVVSRWTAEHVRRGRHFHEHVRRLLRPAGTAVHLFPTLYSPVFALNRVLPLPIATAVVAHLDPSDRERGGQHAAFRAYYSWCRGPTARQLERLASVGFVVRRYIGFFGHPYYDRVKPLRAMHEEVSDWLVRHPIAGLTSYAVAVLERDG
jgi:SAM-dependent methyltransferase